MDNQENRKSPYYYKEIVRVQIGVNRHLIISLRSDGRLSISTTLSARTDETDDGRIIDMHRLHAIPIFRSNIIYMIYALVYVVIRLDENEIAEEDKHFVRGLRELFKEPQERLLKQMASFGHPAKDFYGQAYREYRQEITGR